MRGKMARALCRHHVGIALRSYLLAETMRKHAWCGHEGACHGNIFSASLDIAESDIQQAAKI